MYSESIRGQFVYPPKYVKAESCKGSQNRFCYLYEKTIYGVIGCFSKRHSCDLFNFEAQFKNEDKKFNVLNAKNLKTPEIRALLSLNYQIDVIQISDIESLIINEDILNPPPIPVKKVY